MLFLTSPIACFKCPGSVIPKITYYFRTFEGVLPVMMVYDADWLKEALVKNFSAFTNTRELSVTPLSAYELIGLKGKHWQHVRRILTLEFTTGKQKINLIAF